MTSEQILRKITRAMVLRKSEQASTLDLLPSNSKKQSKKRYMILKHPKEQTTKMWMVNSTFNSIFPIVESLGNKGNKISMSSKKQMSLAKSQTLNLKLRWFLMTKLQRQPSLSRQMRRMSYCSSSISIAQSVTSSSPSAASTASNVTIVWQPTTIIAHGLATVLVRGTDFGSLCSFKSNSYSF